MKRLILVFSFEIAALSAATPLVHQTFENGAEGWTSFGQNGSVRVSHEASEVKTGHGALAFEYDASHGPAFAAWPADTPLDSMRSLSFWLSTDSPTAIAVLLNEKAPGGHYIRIVWSTGKAWQRIELEPSEFTLTEGPNDPPDPDGRLDPKDVQSVGVFDVSQMFGSKLKPDSPIVIEPRTGKHTVWIDDFEISSDPLARPIVSEPGIVLDDFHRPFLQWMTLGGMKLSWEKNGVRAAYQQEEEQYAILTRMLVPMDMRGWGRLGFDVASEKPATLIVSLEEHSPGKSEGPRYSTTVEVLGGGKVDHRAVKFSAFALDPNGPPDPNGELDLDRIKSISFVDITAAGTHETAGNSLWIGNLRTAEKSK